MFVWFFHRITRKKKSILVTAQHDYTAEMWYERQMYYLPENAVLLGPRFDTSWAR